MTTVQVLVLVFRHLTNASRGTANAWHFYHALVLVIMVLC
ncbi:DUF3265 domain-containing protein [Vibrio cholerae]|nr:DUF3265 domain-containing protein [Vibrio cholerae]